MHYQKNQMKNNLYTPSFHLPPPLRKPTNTISILQPKQRHAMDLQGCFFGTFQTTQCLYRSSSGGVARQLAGAVHSDTSGGEEHR